jgi:DNA-binding NarL/FixJ family response regulator
VIRYFVVSEKAAHDGAALVDALTPREREVLNAMADGLTRREIADRLFLSVNTVRTHVQHVLAKLDAHTALEAVAVAMALDKSRVRTARTTDRMNPLPGQRAM